MKDSNRTNFRHRNIDTSRPLPIYREISQVFKKEEHEEPMKTQIGILNGTIDEKLDNKTMIEKEVKKIIELFDKKKAIVIPKTEVIDKNKPVERNSGPTGIVTGDLGTHQLIEYQQTIFNRPKHYIVYSEKERSGSNIKEYEANINDYNFLNRHSELGFTIEDLEHIITTWENDVGSGEMVPLDRCQYILTEYFKSKPTSELNEHLAIVYKYWISRREEYKKSLVRKLWKEQKFSDRNLQTTFRKREREKMRTRRYKKNDQEGLEKLREIKGSMSEYLLCIIRSVKERENLKMKLAEINQYLFELDICRNKSDRIALENKMKKFNQNYKKPKILPLVPNGENIPPNPRNNKKLVLHPVNENVVKDEEIVKPDKFKRIDPKKDREKKKIVTIKNESDKSLKPIPKEIPKIRYILRNNRFGEYMIDRITNNGGSNSPFDETYINKLVNVPNYEEIKDNKQEAFDSHFNSYLNTRTNDLICLSDSDDDQINFSNDLKNISASFRQHQKHKKTNFNDNFSCSSLININ